VVSEASITADQVKPHRACQNEVELTHTYLCGLLVGHLEGRGTCWKVGLRKGCEEFRGQNGHASGNVGYVR
jgi:hypothetical protein